MFPSGTPVNLLNQINKATGFGAGVPALPGAQASGGARAYPAAPPSGGGGRAPAPTPVYRPAAPAGLSAAQIAAQQHAAAVAQSVAQYDQAIGNAQSGLNRLGSQLGSGYSSIDASWQNALNQLLSGQKQGETDYNTNKKQTSQAYVGAKNTIGSNAGATLNGLLRLLGSKGAGGSSAYNQVAPEAVARGATLQRSDAATTNAQNNQSLDSQWGKFMREYNNQVSGANNQRQLQRQGLEQQIENSRGTILQTLAQLAGQRAQAAGGNAVGAASPYLAQANAALDRAATYHTAPISYQTQAYEAPSLASYNTNPQNAPTVNGQGPSNDYFSPYLAALLGKKQPTATPVTG